jgi:hypothetical protein
MINEPITFIEDSFDKVWLEVVRKLATSNWELRNLMVQIRNPSIFNQQFSDRLAQFSRNMSILEPKHVAYTIFPHGLYRKYNNHQRLIQQYNRTKGFYDQIYGGTGSWGTYFRRMTHYDKAGSTVNQLSNIIEAIQTRQSVSKAAYTIVIQNPGGETKRPRGGPCLNYLAVQLVSCQASIVG